MPHTAGTAALLKQSFERRASIELKIWREEAAHRAGYGQLAEYLRRKGRKEGCLLSFDFRQESNREKKEEWIALSAPGGGEDLRVFDITL